MQDKQKVLHTRVSEELYDKISNKAKKHRVTMSNFLRSLVEDYTELSGDIFDIIDDKFREHLKQGIKTILGYQPIVLNKNTNCEICEKKLNKGQNANLAFFENKSGQIVVCDECKNKK